MAATEWREVSISEYNENKRVFLDAVNEGIHFLVTRRGIPVMIIIPVPVELRTREIYPGQKMDIDEVDGELALFLEKRPDIISQAAATA